MDKLRAAASAVAERVERSRLVTAWRASADRTGGSTDRQRGQGLAEYALILALLAIVAIVALTFLGTSVSDLFEDIINEGFRFVQNVIT